MPKTVITGDSICYEDDDGKRVHIRPDFESTGLALSAGEMRYDNGATVIEGLDDYDRGVADALYDVLLAGIDIDNIDFIDFICDKPAGALSQLLMKLTNANKNDTAGVILCRIADMFGHVRAKEVVLGMKHDVQSVAIVTVEAEQQNHDPDGYNPNHDIYPSVRSEFGDELEQKREEYKEDNGYT